MKIKSVTPFLIRAEPSADGWSKGHVVLLVKLTTDTGLIGWGEAYCLNHRERAIYEIMIQIGKALVALPSASPRRFLQHVAAPMDSKHPGIDYACAVSALEIALWDLEGKRAKMPLHELLGGAIIDKVPVYANAWDNPVQSPEAIAARCAKMQAEGYRAVKIYPLRQPSLEASEACVRLTREAIGPDVDLMLDFAIEKDPRRALRAARLFAPYNPYWIEEPVAGDDPSAMAEFRSKIDIRVVTGERQSGIRHYRDILDKRAADILNPDIAGAGGVLTMMEIATLADARSVKISPHSWNSTTVAFLAMLHVYAVMHNATYAELYYDYLELGQRFAKCDYKIEAGFARLPQSPGLGVEIDENRLRELAF